MALEERYTCEECLHSIERHGANGCEVEVEVRDENGKLIATGPCSCTAHEVEDAE